MKKRPLEGHRCQGPKVGVTVSCECGWKSSTWFGKGSRGSAYAEWNIHVDKCRAVGAAAIDAQSAAIEAVLSSGYKPFGETESSTVRVGTSRSPVYGGIGGELSTSGGRPRFAFPNSDRRATVGPRTVCFYRLPVGSRDATDFVNFDTKDLDGIKAHLAKVVEVLS